MEGEGGWVEDKDEEEEVEEGKKRKEVKYIRQFDVFSDQKEISSKYSRTL